MCNVTMLGLFISLCNVYLFSPKSMVPIHTTMLQCVKALDVCVDRKTKELVVDNRRDAYYIDTELETVSDCDYEITKHYGINYYSEDNRCGPYDIEEFNSLMDKVKEK
jgi:hypothetical protein